MTNNNSDASSSRDAILLVAFGTSADAGKRAYSNIEESVSAQFPEHAIYWAFTSQMIRNKLAGRGETVFSIGEALTQINSDSIKTVAVQSLHVVPGEEFNELISEVNAYQTANPSSFQNLTIGRPLLDNFEDMTLVADALVSSLPEEKADDEAVIWLGHGHHYGVCDLNYVAVESQLKQYDPNALVGLVEGGITFDYILSKLKATGAKTVWLSPMMVVSGVHVIEDLVGEEDSWKSELIAEGFTIKEHLPGMGEFDAIADIFVKHITTSMEVH